jgi:TolA-binding protein
MKLGRVKIESAEGRSTFATAVELASMKIDSEWQIEPKVARPSNPAAERVLLPAVTIVYVGKLSELASLEPVVTTGALERELQVRKMERDVDELERLRKLDQTRARQEIERQKALDAERAKTAAPVPNAADPQQQQPPLPVPPAPARPSAALPPPAANGTAQAASGPADPAASDGATVDATVGEPLPGAEVAVPAEAAAPKPARKKRPAEEWRPFQTSPLAPF